MSDKRRRIILDIWIEDRKLIEEYIDQLELSLRELLDKGVTRYRIDIDLFASERPLPGDSDHPINKRRENNDRKNNRRETK